MDEKQLKRVVADLRQARDEGVSIDAILDVAFGSEGYPKLPGGEHEITVRLFKRAIGEDQTLRNLRARGYT